MYEKKNLIKWVAVVAVAVVMLIPSTAKAQTSSINAFSPYTMYGIGELNTPGNVAMRSMGGAGVAVRSINTINLLNPAANSIAPQKSFLFDFGVEGQNYYNSQTVENATKKGVYNTFNFRDIAFRMPLAKKLGVGFSLTPYSSVGYRIKYDNPYSLDDPMWGNMGRIQYDYHGEGDVTEVKLGLGYELFKNFSIGIAAQYFWGNIDRTYTAHATSFIPNGSNSVFSLKGLDNYRISSIKGQIGVQWNALMNDKHLLTVGGTFDFGGDVSPKRRSSVTVNNIQQTEVRGEDMYLDLVMPRQVVVGFNYQTLKWNIACDYVFQNWGGSNSEKVQTGATNRGDHRFYEVAYTNTSAVRMGVEYTPSRMDVRHFMKRWSYRAGFHYGSYNQTYDNEKLAEYSVSLGVGIPMSRRIMSVSAIDVGVEYGTRGFNLAKSMGLVRQQYFKISIGFTLFAGGGDGEHWFLRPKYD